MSGVDIGLGGGKDGRGGEPEFFGALKCIIYEAGRGQRAIKGDGDALKIE